MFPLRERRSSLTAKQSHENSLQKQGNMSTKFDTDQSKVGNFLNSLRQDPGLQSQNLTYNKPFFKINNLESQDSNQVRLVFFNI